MLLTRDSLNIQRHNKGRINICLYICNLWNKIDFKAKIVTKGNFIMIKGSICHEYITFINIYSSNNRAPKYIQKKLAEWIMIIIITISTTANTPTAYIYSRTFHVLSCGNLFKH